MGGGVGGSEVSDAESQRDSSLLLSEQDGIYIVVPRVKGQS